jgi:tRNA nucleotidyltransferase/poly(A) polymerase
MKSNIIDNKGMAKMSPFFKGQQGQALFELAQALWGKGYKVYLAGGCVRDFLLGQDYKDLDVVTDASVEEVQTLFKKTIPVGIKFGIVRVIICGFEFEVARFRSDGPYVDGRHPEYVEFVEPERDAARRDFTVNALFYDLKNDTILDFVNGKADLEGHLLRAVGDPALRFSEDYLRILRLLRFSCQLGFAVEQKTGQAAQELALHLSQVSGERLCLEIVKALIYDPPKALRGFAQWKLGSILFPQWKIEDDRICYFQNQQEHGVVLAHWLLNYQRAICENGIEIRSDSDWQYSAALEAKAKDMQERFRLSSLSRRYLKEAATVLAWPNVWSKLRKGYRASLAQSDSFNLIFTLAQELGVWPDSLNGSVDFWRRQERVLPLLTGQDVLSLAPEKRGLVLRESLYLQYEGLLLDREQSLTWLQKQKQDKR